jgi:hypothetical protein
MCKDNLPKSWCVQNDGSQKFIDLVVRYLNNKKGKDIYTGNTPDGYYGVTTLGNPLISFSPMNFNTLFTIDEFEKRSSPKNEFIRGEEVEVRFCNSEIWHKRIYLTTIEGSTHPFVCVDHGDSSKFKGGEKFNTVGWHQIRKIKQESKLEINISKDGKTIKPSNVEMNNGRIIITL